MFYTEEQIERLEKYRKTFETAVRSDFARNVGSIALRDIESVYDEALGTKYSYNSGCSVCVLQFLKKVGKPFLEESQIYAAKKRKKEHEEEETPHLGYADVKMKDGVITFDFTRALAEEEEMKKQAEKTNTQVVEDVEVKDESLVITASNTNATQKPKTNKRKKKTEENG